ncbi:hypothetical protein B6S12_05475 [Helicobacter valdiviensis]|uniref:Uncharacterized protein n=1 Tax=Helicobacter valdiviensis TaxID=1458358 RepID=A0A2W6MW31_9HELI|nr:hypothetical protein [Helicobacter valdiviensis]PZT48171.1 hypothetical protein B6S12_05475 [Helicobacter valdiviensis]
MQKFLMVLGFFLILSISINAQSPEEAKPSFNCAKATKKVEKMICNDKSGELQKLDRLYSKLYFSILKSIPKDTKEGQNEREELKYFNHDVMSNRNIFQCYFIVPFGTGKQEDFQSNYCIKQIYLEAIAILAFKMINSEANKKKWNFNQRVEKFYYGAAYLEKYNRINFLSNYNLFNNFFESTTKGIVIDFMAYNIAQWNYFILHSRINEANLGEFDEAVKVYKILYEKLYQAFTEDKKLNKLLGK